MARRDGLLGEADLGPLARLGNLPFVLAILLYRVTLSPFIGGQCRFEPTCSRYALAAFRRFGPVRGAWLTLRRVGRCHPFHRGGYDPVPFDRAPPSTPSGTAVDSCPADEGVGEGGGSNGVIDHGPAPGSEEA